MIGSARHDMKTLQLQRILVFIWTVVAITNGYFADAAPWALAKTDPQRQGTILYVTAEALRQIAIMTLPFMPDSASKLLDLLAIPKAERNFSFLAGPHRIAPGVTLPPPLPLFPRYVEPDSRAAQ